jgi:DNA-binding XRE family transcriptional regulator
MTLKDARTQANINQYGLAQLTGLTQTTISLIETGRVQPSAPTRRKIQAVLGSIDWTATYFSNPNNQPDEVIFKVSANLSPPSRNYCNPA